MAKFSTVNILYDSFVSIQKLKIILKKQTQFGEIVLHSGYVMELFLFFLWGQKHSCPLILTIVLLSVVLYVTPILLLNRF